ncbi:MAG: tetratricopeptide repeat protein, partial [Planctomycetes bacterium]|nr:tetratricopeptide repeat protein [Planctomycetota bacterium]
NKQLYDWLLEDGPAARDGVIQGLLAIHPASVDTHIEYAYNLADQDRFADALEHLDAAETLDPTNAKLWFARGALHKRKRQFEEAKFAFREAVRHSVDFEPAIQELIWLCENIGERREVLSFIGAELLRQTTFGNGIVTLVVNMQYGIPPRELLGHVKRIRDAKPNLWIAWQCVCRQAGFAELMSERTEAAQENVRRFPSIAELWLDLAEVQRVLNDTDAEQRSLQRAIELAPNYPHAVRMLVQACERADQKDDAKKACTQAIRRTPLAGAPYIEYADLLFRRQEYDEAIKQAAKGIALDPWHDESWNIVSNWCVQLDRVKDLVDMARSLTKKQPGNWRSWLRLALALQARSWFWLSAGVQVQTACANQDEEDARIDECIAAYDEAIKRNPAGYDVFDPRNPVPRDLHDSKAEMLANAGRYDDAAKACNPPAFKGKPPVNLRGRAAWVSAMKGDYEIAKQQMAKVLREDKAYQWGWDRMFDWGYATNDFKAVHDAANDLLRANPQSALAVAMRGEALVRMDEKDAALNDLRAAHRKDPCLQRAVFALFDQQIADEDLVGAEATLRSMEEHLFEGLIEGRRIQFHAAKANQAEALRLYKDLCVSPFPVPPALDTATRAVDLAGWKAEADVIIKDAMKEPNANLHLALLYATGWNPNQANDLPDRIAAIDQALAKLPGNFRFLDLKAELLSNGTQFERAWQTCKEKTFPIDQFALDGRGVWVMFRAGQRTEAIFAMRDLVKKHPKYYWGWMQLADWYGQQQKWVDVLTVAEQLVVINPRDPVGFGYRGQAKENLNDVQAARADYIHSIDLQPNYMFGVWQLFNVYVRAGEWQRAEKLLDKAKKHAEPADWALRRVDLLIYQNKKGPFAAEFENLCKKSAKSPWVIDQSLMFVVQAGWWSEAEEVLHRCLDLGPHICDPWVRLRVAMGDRNVGEDVQQMNSSRPERTNCIAAYAIELAYAKDPGGLRRWILTHEDDLRADTPCWAKVGFALSVIQDWAGIIEWMSDWTDHPKALPGMLLPLIRAHRSLREVDDARKVSLHALTKLNPDFAASFHKVWLMFDSAMKGETLPVQRYLDGSDLGGFDGYHQMIAAMVRAWWLTATDKQTGFARARKVLADAATFAPPIIPDPALTKAYQQCVAELADLRGTFGAKLWRWWRWLMPKLPAVQKTN